MKKMTLSLLSLMFTFSFAAYAKPMCTGNISYGSHYTGAFSNCEINDSDGSGLPISIEANSVFTNVDINSPVVISGSNVTLDNCKIVGNLIIEDPNVTLQNNTTVTAGNI